MYGCVDVCFLLEGFFTSTPTPRAALALASPPRLPRPSGGTAPPLPAPQRGATPTNGGASGQTRCTSAWRPPPLETARSPRISKAPSVRPPAFRRRHIPLATAMASQDNLPPPLCLLPASWRLPRSTATVDGSPCCCPGAIPTGAATATATAALRCHRRQYRSRR